MAVERVYKLAKIVSDDGETRFMSAAHDELISHNWSVQYHLEEMTLPRGGTGLFAFRNFNECFGRMITWRQPSILFECEAYVFAELLPGRYVHPSVAPAGWADGKLVLPKTWTDCATMIVEHTSTVLCRYIKPIKIVKQDIHRG